MIDINVANFLTIGGISLVFFAVLMYLLNYFQINTNWLQGGG